MAAGLVPTAIFLVYLTTVVTSQPIGQVIGPGNPDFDRAGGVVHVSLQSADCLAPVANATILCVGYNCMATSNVDGSYRVTVRQLPTIIEVRRLGYQTTRFSLRMFHETFTLQCAVGITCSCHWFPFDITTPCGVPIDGVNITYSGGHHVVALLDGRYKIKACKLPVNLTLSKTGYGNVTVPLTAVNQTFVMSCHGILGCPDDILTMQVTSDCVDDVGGVTITSPDLIQIRPRCPGLYEAVVCKRPANVTFSKPGFATTSNLFTRGYGRVKLGCSGQPFMVKDLQDKYRQLGQNVQFCCSAEVKPSTATLHYKWFFNDLEIAGQTGMMLTKTNLQAGDEGTYKCVAYTDIGGVVKSTMSQASLDLIANVNDFSGLLVDLQAAIIPNCIENIRQCVPRSCKTNSAAAEQCLDDGYVCPDLVNTVPATCPAGMGLLSFNQVQSCKCCARPMTTVNIEVTGSDGNKVNDAVVYILGKVSGRTDANGRLSTTVAPGAKRLHIHVEDETRQYINTIEVFQVEEFPLGSVDIPVTLIKRPAGVVINPLVENTFPLNGAGKIVIPPGSVCSTTGEPYTNSVTVFYTFLDPTQLDQIRSSPGEFVTVDQNGVRQPLVSRGVFNLQFQDGQANPVTVQDIMIMDDRNMSLWNLGPDGTWVQVSPAGNSRKKRAIEIGNLGNLEPFSGDGLFNWYNIDKFPQNKPCWAKVRAYDVNAAPSELVNNYAFQFKPEFEIFTTDADYLALTYFSYRSNIGTACYEVRCDIDTNINPDTLGIIRLLWKNPVYGPMNIFEATPFAANPVGFPATPGNLQYTVVGNTIELKYYSIQTGPFYESMQTCVSSGDADQAFRFGLQPPSLSDYPSDDRCVARIAYTGNALFLASFPSANPMPVARALSTYGMNGVVFGTQLTFANVGDFYVACVEVACPLQGQQVNVQIFSPQATFICEQTIVLPDVLESPLFFTNATADVAAAITECKAAVGDYAAVVYCTASSSQSK